MFLSAPYCPSVCLGLCLLIVYPKRKGCTMSNIPDVVSRWEVEQGWRSASRQSRDEEKCMCVTAVWVSNWCPFFHSIFCRTSC